jgi:hypothetical protein
MAWKRKLSPFTRKREHGGDPADTGGRRKRSFMPPPLFPRNAGR